MGRTPQPARPSPRAAAAGGDARNGQRFTWLIPMAVLAASLTLTGAGVVLLDRSIAAAAEARFKRLVERVERDLHLRFQQPVYAVDGLRSLYAAVPAVDRQAFREYVRARDLPRNFPAVRGLGYVQRVPREELGRFIATEQASAAKEGSEPGFQVQTQARAGDLYVLRFIEPLEYNSAALGFDMASEAVRREAIERAARTGQPTLTSRITLLQDEQRGASFMIMAPIYRPGAPLGTAQERLAALSGLAVAPVVVQQLMAGLAELTERQLHLQLFDGPGTEAAQRVFATEPVAEPEPRRWFAPGRDFSVTRELTIGAHSLTLQARSTPALDAGINPRLPAALGVGGTLMSLLLSLSVWLLAVGRARAERRAREMTADLERLAKVVQHTSNAVVIIDDRERVTWVNEGFERVFGYRRAEVVGHAPDELLRRAGADADELQLMRQALWRGTSWRGELRLRDRQDRDCWIDLEIQPLREPGGPAVVGLMAIASDITASKLAQQRLQESLNAREQAEVALREARARAEEANVAKSQFLANMSHEIRTPMNAIIGMSNLVMESELDDDQRELLGVVQDSAQSLLALINDILDFSKIEAGHLEFERIGFELHEQVAATVRTLGARAREKGLTLDWAIARDVPRHVMGDPHRLRQVLLNLLSNALKFTLQGGVTLVVSRRPEAAGEGQCLLHFRVRDTGIGIAPDKLHSVFEPFTQADASTTRRFGGTGLGLAICRRLVSLMGGELWAESELGKGSTFHFTARLGLQADADDDAPADEGDGEPKPRVLVLDAAPAPDTTLQATLAQWQLQPVVVGELAEALRRLESPARHHRAIQSVLVRASTLQLQPPEQLASLLPRLCDSATHGRTVILLEDEPLPEARSRCFGTRVPWPGVPSALFDAMTTVEGFTHSALSLADAGAAGSVGSAPARHRILLAEDNVINQKLALRLLEGMGHEVDVVADGLQALQRAQAEDFDLILMDVQMPVMGGFEATAALRAHEQPLGRHTPIVAMTAHAMVGDRERCLAAGMDGYLSKPISKLELYRAVQEHARRHDPAPAAPAADGTAPQAGPAPSDAASGAALYDRAQAVTMLGGDEGLFDEVAGMFVAHAEAERQALRGAAAAGDLERLGRVAHGIKGSAATVGAAITSEQASALEQACQAQDRERALALVDGLCERLEALEVQLKRDLPAAAAPG